MSFMAYPEYKDSGIEWLGSVPAPWNICRIKNTATLNPSKREVRNLPSDTVVSFIPMEVIGEQGELDLSQTKNISDVMNGYTYAAEGDVMIAKITPCFENGKGAIANNLTNGIGFATTEVIPIRPNRKSDASFLYYLLKSDPFKSMAEGSMYGAGGQKRVSDNFVAEYHCAYPSVNERDDIATFLDHETQKIDRLIEKQQQLIKLLQEKRQVVISHAVTKGLNPNAKMKDSGVEWLGGIPEHWGVKKFSHVSVVVRGGSPRPAGDPTLFNGDYSPWVTVAEITNGNEIYLNETNTFLTKKGSEQCRVFKAGTLLLSNSGATLGVPKILNIDANANDGVVGFECLSGSVDIEYAYFYLHTMTDDLRERTKQGAGQPNLNTDIVKNIAIPNPPLAEQKEIVIYLHDSIRRLDVLKAAGNRFIDLLKERRTALISAAVTGKIDVRNNS